METYHKINSIFKRDERGRFLEGEWSCPEFEYLADNMWHGTEKIDGTNVRIGITLDDDEELSLTFGGRTDNAQMPMKLVQRLEDVFRTGEMAVKLIETFSTGDNEITDVTLYGEGYGAGIQKGGGNYISDGVDFILFDVRVGDWWLLPSDVRDVASKLGIRCVPYLGEMTLNSWIKWIQDAALETPKFAMPFTSAFEGVSPEGVVLVPSVPLFTRQNKRIVTKVKVADFR